MLEFPITCWPPEVLVLACGRTDPHGEQTLRHAYVYALGRWYVGPAIRRARSGAAVAALGGSIFVLGGSGPFKWLGSDAFCREKRRAFIVRAGAFIG